MVTPGQVWQDRDPRETHRKLLVKELTETHAICVPSTADGRAITQRVTRIRLDRFATRFALIKNS